MPPLPILSGKEIIKALSKLGYYEIRQRGSHIRLYCNNKKSVTMPNHKIIGFSLLRKIIRDIDISVEDFLKLLN